MKILPPLPRWVRIVIPFLLISAVIINATGATLLYLIKWRLNSWGSSEFIISYAGGFVRRGLFGEGLYWLTTHWGISPYRVILWLTRLCLLGVFGVFLWLFHRRRLNWWIIFAPVFCGFVTCFIRKDFLFYLVLFGLLWLLRSANPSNLRRIIVIAVCSLMIFIHEAFVFVGVPVCLLLLWSAPRGGRIWACAGAVITGGLFLLFAYYNGTQDQVNAIAAAWNKVVWPDIVFTDVDNTLTSLGWDKTYHMWNQFEDIVFSDDFGGYGLLMLRAIDTLIAYWLVTNFVFVLRRPDSRIRQSDQTMLSTLYIFAWLTLLPMTFFFAVDWGRQFQYFAVIAFSTLLIVPRRRLLLCLPKWALKATYRFNRRLNSIVVPTRGLLLITMLVFSVSPFVYNPVYTFRASVLGTIFHAIYTLAFDSI